MENNWPETVDELLDECQADANRKHKQIRKPYEYVIGYATNRGWPER